MINATAYMIPPIIEKMDTASLDIKHGNRAMIYVMTHLTPPAVVEESTDHNKECDGNVKIRKRGSQHVYKWNTNSSRRLMMAHKASMTKGTPSSKLGMQCDKTNWMLMSATLSLLQNKELLLR
jgi:hypothetical protein